MHLVAKLFDGAVSTVRDYFSIECDKVIVGIVRSRGKTGCDLF